MRSPRDPARRCPLCRLHLDLCLCAEVPRVDTSTRVALVLHQLEARKSTNTGRLAARCLSNSILVAHGRLTDGIVPGREIVDREPYPWQPANGPCVLLYPDQSARSIEDWRGCNDLTLVVLDGTWRQTARARLRLPGLADLPVATLPEARPRWALRRDPRPGRVGTLEAVARALGVIEGDAVQAALARVLQLFFERTQSMRGR